MESRKVTGPGTRKVPSPSDGVCEALHFRPDVLEVPDGLPRLVRVRVLQLRDHARTHDVIRVRLNNNIYVHILSITFT
jgi:hypothetical protein